MLLLILKSTSGQDENQQCCGLTISHKICKEAECKDGHEDRGCRIRPGTLVINFDQGQSSDGVKNGFDVGDGVHERRSEGKGSQQSHRKRIQDDSGHILRWIVDLLCQMCTAVRPEIAVNSVPNRKHEGPPITRPAGTVGVVGKDPGPRGVVVAGDDEQCDHRRREGHHGQHKYHLVEEW